MSLYQVLWVWGLGHDFIPTYILIIWPIVVLAWILVLRVRKWGYENLQMSNTIADVSANTPFVMEWQGSEPTHLANTFNMWSYSCKIFNVIPGLSPNSAMIS